MNFIKAAEALKSLAEAYGRYIAKDAYPFPVAPIRFSTELREFVSASDMSAEEITYYSSLIRLYEVVCEAREAEREMLRAKNSRPATVNLASFNKPNLGITTISVPKNRCPGCGCDLDRPGSEPVMSDDGYKHCVYCNFLVSEK